MTVASPTLWADVMASLGAAGDRLAALMRARGDDDDVADVYATMLGITMDVYLGQIAIQAEHPVFAPCTGYFQRLGTPNPDTIYRRAPIDTAGIYRIVGERGTARDVTLMAFSEAMRGWPAVDVTPFCDGSGAFDLIASATRPEGHTGHWLELEPGMAALWLRVVSDRWDVDVDSWIAITRLDHGPRERMTAEWLGKRLASLATRVERATEYGIRHVGELIDAGFVNRFKLIDYAATGAMPLQSYQEGVFRLADDEALLIEARLPPGCSYFSWALTDAMFVTLDWTNAHTSINSGQAAPDADGVLRLVVSRHDPGTPNWLETTGHRLGVVQARTTGSADAPEIMAERLPFSAIRQRPEFAGSRITPAQRTERLRHRQLYAQRRRLW